MMDVAADRIGLAGERCVPALDFQKGKLAGKHYRGSLLDERGKKNVGRHGQTG